MRQKASRWCSCLTISSKKSREEQAKPEAVVRRAGAALAVLVPVLSLVIVLLLTADASAVCGDSFLDPNNECCDDGNVVSGDGCNGDCTCPPGPGIETCDLTATTSPIVSLPADRTFTVSTFTCTDKAPTTMFGMPCSGFEDADNTLGGTFDVHFEESPDPNENEIDLTVDISNITMTPFTLCGFLIDVTSHVLNDQDLRQAGAA